MTGALVTGKSSQRDPRPHACADPATLQRHSASTSPSIPPPPGYPDGEGRALGVSIGSSIGGPNGRSSTSDSSFECRCCLASRTRPTPTAQAVATAVTTRSPNRATHFIMLTTAHSRRLNSRPTRRHNHQAALTNQRPTTSTTPATRRLTSTARPASKAHRPPHNSVAPRASKGGFPLATRATPNKTIPATKPKPIKATEPRGPIQDGTIRKEIPTGSRSDRLTARVNATVLPCRPISSNAFRSVRPPQPSAPAPTSNRNHERSLLRLPLSTTMDVPSQRFTAQPCGTFTDQRIKEACVPSSVGACMANPRTPDPQRFNFPRPSAYSRRMVNGVFGSCGRLTGTRIPCSLCCDGTSVVVPSAATLTMDHRSAPAGSRAMRY